MRTVPIGTSQFVAQVDDEDYEAVAARKWSMSGGYAVTYEQYGTISMHRMILGLRRGERIYADHRNGDRLDNRRSNLRVCTPRENQRNRTKGNRVRVSRFKGVSRFQRGWRAAITVDGRWKYVGVSKTEEGAALLYDAAARAHFGEFACVNFPNEGERGALAA